MNEEFAKLFEESLKELETRPGAIVRGTVVSIEKDIVLIDAGLESESAIPAEQFKNSKGDLELAVGDQVDVVLDAVEDGFGETILSREKARRHEAWVELEKAYEEKITVVGIINGKVGGGFTVEVNSVRAFLPGSLVDVRPVRDIRHLEGKELEFKVIKLDAKRNYIVVSRRAVLEEENSAERDILLQTLDEGVEVKGIVKNLTDYGAFVDLGGVDGLLHITDMTWKRVKHPSEIVSVGDEINVKVLKLDKEKYRVSLGMKQMVNDPWEEIANRYPEGTKLIGQVTNLTDYGCFVEILEGVEGLVHVSEMDWTNKNIHPSKVVNLGDSVEVMVLEIDEERRRISLGLKQCKPNPWKEFAKRYNKGDKVFGRVESIIDFGIFIGLDGGLEGLVHLSDISWNKSEEEALSEYKKGEEVTAVVLQVDAKRERISLSIKHLVETETQATSTKKDSENHFGQISNLSKFNLERKYIPGSQLRFMEKVYSKYDFIQSIISNAYCLDISNKSALSLDELEAFLEDLGSLPILLDVNPGELHSGLINNIQSICYYEKTNNIMSFGRETIIDGNKLKIFPKYLDFLDPLDSSPMFDDRNNTVENLSCKVYIFTCLL